MATMKHQGERMTDYFLSYGSHRTAETGRCAMEWISYLAGEPHSDSPACVSPVLTRFCMQLNDALDDERRQRLRPYLARTIGTHGDGLDMHRSWLATDWLIRTYVPTWLSVAGLDAPASRLRVLPPVLTDEALDRAMVDLDSAGTDAAAAWVAARAAAKDAAWAAAWDAAGDAAWDAAWTVARDAACTVARDAAWAVARAATWVPAKDAAVDAAWVAAGDVAGDAAWAVAWATAGDAAEDAAEDAARAALRPTVIALQDSAFDLLEQMLPTEVIQLPVASDAAEVCGLPIGA